MPTPNTPLAKIYLWRRGDGQVVKLGETGLFSKKSAGATVYLTDNPATARLWAKQLAAGRTPHRTPATPAHLSSPRAGSISEPVASGSSQASGHVAFPTNSDAGQKKVKSCEPEGLQDLTTWQPARSPGRGKTAGRALPLAYAVLGFPVNLCLWRVGKCIRRTFPTISSYDSSSLAGSRPAASSARHRSAVAGSCVTTSVTVPGACP
jgi:hypothetical protein